MDAEDPTTSDTPSTTLDIDNTITVSVADGRNTARAKFIEETKCTADSLLTLLSSARATTAAVKSQLTAPESTLDKDMVQLCPDKRNAILHSLIELSRLASSVLPSDSLNSQMNGAERSISQLTKNLASVESRLGSYGEKLEVIQGKLESVLSNRISRKSRWWQK
jgi:hypothetical protein